MHGRNVTCIHIVFLLEIASKWYVIYDSYPFLVFKKKRLQIIKVTCTCSGHPFDMFFKENRFTFLEIESRFLWGFCWKNVFGILLFFLWKILAKIINECGDLGYIGHWKGESTNWDMQTSTGVKAIGPSVSCCHLDLFLDWIYSERFKVRCWKGVAKCKRWWHSSYQNVSWAEEWFRIVWVRKTVLWFI